MAFSSFPAYNLDPSNCQQAPNHRLENAGFFSINDIPWLPPPAPPAALQSHGPGNSIRPGSMAERAHIANIPMPEAALKCPRCESTNTKFCYFNNYTLTQPRHFCKTCRRYWTQGGALRSVPVGGSCRRNNKKSSKSNNNRSNASTSSGACHTGRVCSTKNAASLPSTGGGGGGGLANTLLGTSAVASSPPLGFMAPNLVHPLGEHFGFSREFSALSNYGQNITAPSGGAGDLNFQVAGSDSGISGGLAAPHSTGFYPFGGGLIDSPGLVGGASRIGEKMLSTGLLHLPSMKLEHDPEHNLSRRFQGMAWNCGQHSFDGAGTAWTDGSADL